MELSLVAKEKAEGKVPAVKSKDLPHLCWYEAGDHVRRKLGGV